MNIYDTLPADLQPPTRGEKIAEGLRSAGHKIASIPIIKFTGLGTILTGMAAVVDSIDGFVNKSFADGVRKGVGGVVDTGTTSALTIWEATNPLTWMISPTNIAVALANPNMDTIPELARKGADSVLKNILPEAKPLPKMDQAALAAAQQQAMFGPAPAMTVGAIPAGAGFAQGLPQTMDYSLPSNPAPHMPENHWTNKRAEQMGQDPEAMRAAFAKGNTEEVRAMQAAARGEATLGAS